MTVKLLGKGARFTQGSFLADTNSIALFVMAMFHDFHYYSKNFSISAEDILKIATHPVKLNPDHPIFSFIKNAQNSLNDSDTLESAFEKIGFDKKDSKEEKKENDKAKKLIEDTRVAINAFYGDYFKQLESIKEQELGKIEKIFQNILFVQKKMKDVHDAMAYTSIPNEDKIKISDLLFHHIKDQQIYNSSRIEEMVNQMQKLEKCDLNEVQKIIARDIEKNGQQINENVDDIYTLAKPESLMQEEKSMQNDQKGNEGKLGNTSWIWAVNSLTVPLSSVPTQRDELAALEKDQKETKAREIIAQEEKERELKAAKEKELQQKAEQQKKYVEAKRREEEQKEIQRKIEIQKRLEAEKMERLKKEREAKENAQREAKERELQRRRYIEAKRREEEKKSAGKRRQIKDRRQKVAQEQKSQVLEKKKQKLIPKGYSLRKPVVPGTTVRPGTKPGFPIISRRPSRNQNNQK
jgi:hypothetical protein